MKDSKKTERLKENEKSSHFEQDGAVPEEDESETIDPFQFKIIQDEKFKDKKSKEKIFVGKDSIDDFSGRVINAISNPIRLKILLFLDSESNKTPELRKVTDEKEIYRHLKNKYNLSISGLYQNHLRLLLDAGLIRRKSGERESETVFIYETVPGALESLIRILLNLNKDVKKIIEEESHFDSGYPMIKVLGGVQDQAVFELSNNNTLIGRIGNTTEEYLKDLSVHVVLSNNYKSVTRIFNKLNPGKAPHAKLYCDENEWYIEDCGNNKCGTFVNEKKVGKRKLQDYDTIGLSRGKYGVDLLFKLPQPNSASTKNYFEDLNHELSEEEQIQLASKMKILLNKVKTPFLLETMDNIIEKIRFIQEVETLHPGLDLKDVLREKQYDRKLNRDIMENLDEDENIDFGDPLVNKFYYLLKEEKKKDRHPS